MSRRRAPLALMIGALAVSCGSRSSLLSDEEAGVGGVSSGGRGIASGGSRAGGASSGGALLGAGGMSSVAGGSFNSGGVASGGGQRASGGAGGEVLGGGGGGISSGGQALGGDGSGGTDDCGPDWDCFGMRPFWLMEAAWGQVGEPFEPEVASCVNYQADDSIDAFDYLKLIDGWWSGCSEVGPRHPNGSCFFPGDINGDRCLDYDDYNGIALALGLEATFAHPCADLVDDGLIDELDLAFFLRELKSLACPGTEFDPNLVLGAAVGPAVACGMAPLGDISGDFEATYRDLAGVLSHFGWRASARSECLDVNRDSFIDIADALHIMNLSPIESPHCGSTLTSLEAFVSAQKSCVVDSDCGLFDAGCSHIAEHCSRVVSLQAHTDVEALRLLTETTSDCLPASGCRRCEDPAPMAACRAGICSAL